VRCSVPTRCLQMIRGPTSVSGDQAADVHFRCSGGTAQTCAATVRRVDLHACRCSCPGTCTPSSDCPQRTTAVRHHRSATGPAIPGGAQLHDHRDRRCRNENALSDALAGRYECPARRIVIVSRGCGARRACSARRSAVRSAAPGRRLCPWRRRAGVPGRRSGPERAVPRLRRLPNRSRAWRPAAEGRPAGCLVERRWH
jgi:hypothetical protein